ncbi:MAG TPA: YaiI/YqxD family protein [Bacillus bacterium]|nr:YaiI/YqxD family protein [Bacillus sp. (in: firmicutes)]
MTTILVDADACPVIDLTIKVAKQFEMQVILICDTSHYMEREGAETITVSKGSDAVDFVLVNRVQEGDIVVTQDYGLAAMVLAKQGFPIDQNGRLYTAENIDQLLFSRHLAKKIRQAGGRTKGPKKRSKEADLYFEENLKQLCEKVKGV